MPYQVLYKTYYACYLFIGKLYNNNMRNFISFVQFNYTCFGFTYKLFYVADDSMEVSLGSISRFLLVCIDCSST